MIMPTMTVTDARKNLFGLVDAVANGHCGYCIVGKRNQAVLISMEGWNTVRESRCHAGKVLRMWTHYE